METHINWEKRVLNNRVKARGIPWSEKEKEALRKGIPADKVRAGILTKEELKERENKEDKKLIEMTLEEMKAVADNEGIKYHEKDVSRPALMSEIAQKRREKGQK